MKRGHRRWHGRLWTLLVPLLALLLACAWWFGPGPPAEGDLPDGVPNVTTERR